MSIITKLNEKLFVNVLRYVPWLCHFMNSEFMQHHRNTCKVKSYHFVRTTLVFTPNVNWDIFHHNPICYFYKSLKAPAIDNSIELKDSGIDSWVTYFKTTLLWNLWCFLESNNLMKLSELQYFQLNLWTPWRIRSFTNFIWSASRHFRSAAFWSLSGEKDLVWFDSGHYAKPNAGTESLFREIHLVKINYTRYGIHYLITPYRFCWLLS